jgi:hypothetical protein
MPDTQALLGFFFWWNEVSDRSEAEAKHWYEERVAALEGRR